MSPSSKSKNKHKEGHKKKKVFIVIPAYNEEKSIPRVIKDLKQHGYNNIVVVDDGSSDRTFDVSKKLGVFVLRHRINRGLGGALNTGINAALELGADIIVTFDADGQHDVNDLPKMIKPLLSGEADVVIGSRFLNKKELRKMPLFRKLGIRFLNFLTYLLFHVRTTDSQSGLRAFSRRSASLIRINANRMEVSSEFFREFGIHKLRVKEVPIRVIYTDYSLRKGQATINGIKVILKLIMRRLIH